MRVPLSTILCMLGLCVCFDIVLRIFNIHVSWWNGTFFNTPNQRSTKDETDNERGTPPPTAA
jgi:hypothetical protein